MPDDELDDLNAELPEGWTAERLGEDPAKFQISDGQGGSWCVESTTMALLIAEYIQSTRES